MTQIEIHDKIDQNNLLIQDLFNASTFVLNPAIADLLKENTELQELCQHEFKDGQCIYCYKSEEE